MWHGYYDNENFTVDAQGKLVKTEPLPAPALPAHAVAVGERSSSKFETTREDVGLSPFFDESEEEEDREGEGGGRYTRGKLHSC